MPGQYFGRKTNGVAEEEGTFLEESRKLDPSRIFFMASHGVSAHPWMENALYAREGSNVTVAPRSRAKGL